MSTVTATLSSGTAVDLSNGRHEWRADEPEDAGGADTAPNPYEFLLGALAACTCITVSLYAQRKGLVLHSVTARFEHERVHHRDCEDCAESPSAFLDRIRGEIIIVADVDEAQQVRLAEVARQCPVHRTLENQVVFDDDVRFADQ